ncbi:MAG: hypothetical protein WCP19_12625, partial [Chloroflexota bacterium]
YPAATCDSLRSRTSSLMQSLVLPFFYLLGSEITKEFAGPRFPHIISRALRWTCESSMSSANLV